MAKRIKTLVDRIERALRKGLGTYYAPDEIVEEIHAESLAVWRKYIDQYEKTQKISMFLRPFQVAEDVTITNGEGVLANPTYYQVSCMADDTIVQMVDEAHWGNRLNDSVRSPSADYPIANIFAVNKIRVRPKSITQVTIGWLKQPTKPVYAYNVAGDDYIYDDTASSDYEWNEELDDEIMNRVLANLGISSREEALVQYSNLEQAKEQ